MITKEPIDFVRALPNPENILEWHFVIDNLDDDRYRGGVFHGLLVFPPDYPFSPPALSLRTPTGRFQVNTKLCLSITDFHPESWNPMWSVSSILAAVVSFFVENTNTYGAVKTSDSRKRAYAKESLAYNANDPQFRKLFPELMERHRQQLACQEAERSVGEEQRQQQGADSSGTGGAAAAATVSTSGSGQMGDRLGCLMLGVPVAALVAVLAYGAMSWGGT